MSGKENSGTVPPIYELSITRTFDAPRELVWKAWTDPDMAKQWMGPRGFQTTETVMPLAAGAEWTRSMEGNVPGTERMACLLQHGKTLEVVPPEKLVFTFSWGERASVGLGDSPYKENMVTVLFTEHGSKTTVHFTQSPFATEGERNGHAGGWNSSLDKFAEFLQALQPGRMPSPDDVPTELHLRRTFAASRQAVFDAWTTAEGIEQWWGPNGFTNHVKKLEAHSGGAIEFDLHGPDGAIYPLTGRFLEVYAPYRLAFLSTPLDADGKPMFEMWNSVFLQDVDGGTEVILDVHVTKWNPGVEMYLRGMVPGWSQSLDRLGAYVAKADGR